MAEGSSPLQTHHAIAEPKTPNAGGSAMAELTEACSSLLDLLLQSASLKSGRESPSLANGLRDLYKPACCESKSSKSSPVGEWLNSLVDDCPSSNANGNKKCYESLSAYLPERCVAELSSLKSALHDSIDPAVVQRLENAAHLATRLRAVEHQQDAELETRKREALYHFAYGLSHELNNPLANISTRAGVLLQSTQENGLPRDLLSAIVENSLRGCEMLGDLMLVARPPKLHFESTPILDLLSELTASARNWLSVGRSELNLRVPAKVHRPSRTSRRFNAIPKPFGKHFGR